MPSSARFASASLKRFKELFLSKAEYLALIREMSLKERALDWRPTTEFEKVFRAKVAEKHLVKVGAGVLKVTSYRISESANHCEVYLSYGGKALQLTAEGRQTDIGFFLSASQTDTGLAITVESKRSHYRIRSCLLNLLFIVAGLTFAVIPGLLVIAFLLYEPRLLARKVDNYIWPSLETLLGPRA